MDAVFSLALAFIIGAVIYQLISSLTFRRRGRLPPGPYSIPVIGNILQLGKNPNQSLAKLSKTYGPLMSLKLGIRTAIVVSSPTLAKEILQKKDLVFSSRTIPCAAHAYDRHKFSVGWLPVSTQWRILRKISKEHMFTVQRLDASQHLRQEKFKQLGEYLRICCVAGEAVKIGEAVFITTLNLMSTTLFSTHMASFDSNSSQELIKNMWGLSEVLAKPNLADYFPFLRYIDPQGIVRKSKHYLGNLFDNFDYMIKKRLKERGLISSQDYAKRQDMLETLLDQMDNDQSGGVNINDIKHLFLDLFIAGVDTSSFTIEWGMAELFRNPEKMAKARAELVEIIGQKKTVEESDISKLPYLQAIVKETYRLHPAVPLLIPHKADANVEIYGYKVPKDADILINTWAIGRDSGIWSDPQKFIPERFLESEIDVNGQHFELIPFGGGRRICPGIPLAYRMVHLALAFLVHNFQWKLQEGIQPEDINMEEHFGLSIQKAIPLQAIPIEFEL